MLMLTITHRTYIRIRVYPEMGISPMSNWVAQKKSLPHIGGRLLLDHRKLTWVSSCLRLVLFPSMIQRMRFYRSRVECPSRERLCQGSRCQSGLPHSSTRLSPPLWSYSSRPCRLSHPYSYPPPAQSPTPRQCRPKF